MTRELRVPYASPLEDGRGLYVTARLEEQVHWYGKKARATEVPTEGGRTFSWTSNLLFIRQLSNKK